MTLHWYCKGESTREHKREESTRDRTNGAIHFRVVRIISIILRLLPGAAERGAAGGEASG